MKNGNPRHQVGNTGLLRTGRADDKSTAGDHDQVWVVDIVSRAGAGDNTDRHEGAVAEPPPDVFGSEHSTPGHGCEEGRIKRHYASGIGRTSTPGPVLEAGRK